MEKLTNPSTSTLIQSIQLLLEPTFNPPTRDCYEGLPEPYRTQALLLYDQRNFSHEDMVEDRRNYWVLN